MTDLMCFLNNSNVVRDKSKHCDSNKIKTWKQLKNVSSFKHNSCERVAEKVVFLRVSNNLL